MRAARKHLAGRCLFCECTILHAHRVVPGAEGGNYDWQNVLPLCPSHHSAVHLGLITILSRHGSALGRNYVRYSEGGEEKLIEEPNIFRE